MFAILALGFAIRLPFIAVDTRITSDVESLTRWAQTIHSQGLTSIYDGTRVNYPPASLYLLAAAAWLEARLPVEPSSRSLRSTTSGERELRAGGALIALVKLPAVLADLLTAMTIAWPLLSRAPRLAIAVSAAYVFNAGIWYVSAFWGQTDSVYTLFVVVSVMVLERGAVVPSWLAFTLALGTKLQSIAVAPLLIAWSLYRHGMRGLVIGLGTMTIAGAVLATPWLIAGNLGDVLRHLYLELPTEAPRVDVSAFNLWYLIRLGRVHQISSYLHPLGLPFSYQEIGIALFGGFALIVVGLVIKRGGGLALPAAALCLGMFMLLTQMHERYLIAALPLLLLSAVEMSISRAQPVPLLFQTGTEAGGSGARRTHHSSAWLAYGVLSLTFFFNLITIASFAPSLWINLVVPQPSSPVVLLLQALSFVAAGTNGLVLVWLVVGMGRRR